MRELVRDNDLVTISEHWLHENRLSMLDQVSNNVFFCARASRFAAAENYGCQRGQGGVAILWDKRIIGITEVKSIAHDRICVVRVQTSKGGVIYVYAVYLPAQGSGEEYNAILDDLAELVEAREEQASYIICGDTNADMGRLGGPRCSRQASKQGEALHHFVNEFGLIVSNGRVNATGPVDTYVGPTGSSMIDHILVSADMEDDILTCHTSDDNVLNTSDHRVVSVTLNVENVRARAGDVKRGNIIRWEKLSQEDIRVKYTTPLEADLFGLIDVMCKVEIKREDVDKCFDDLIKCITLRSKAIPTSKFKKHLRPYWNEKLTLLKKQKVLKHSLWVNKGRPRVKGDIYWEEHKEARKAFVKELRRMHREYENDSVAQVINTAETDRGCFWRLVKKSRGNDANKAQSIKTKQGKVVNDTDEVLNVWRQHFEDLYTPKQKDGYEEEHYNVVTEKVKSLNEGNEIDEFLRDEFTCKEVKEAINKLHKKKACGYDGISTEHIVYAGEPMISLLTLLYNHIVRLEYIPVNLRRGTQVPLYKGKKAFSLETDSYRGITLLTNFNKIYEIMVWARVKDWWESNNIISDLQGAGKKGQSCVHTAFLLQESIADAMESNKQIFVAFYDVSKAYDTVWTDGLFYQLHKMGIRGRTWRLLYRAYVNFRCRVRIGNKCSEWYDMLTGIHQGGFLSSTKYIAFINPLVEELEQSNLCCKVGLIRASPVSYADDLATACVSKGRIDKVLEIVFRFSRRWRFEFNAGKSAIMVYGEDRKTFERNSTNRIFKLGKDRIKERAEYDHVGIKACLFHEGNNRLEEKISKGRRALNATAGLGIRHNGLNIGTCNLIFWVIVIPIITFGCEIWQLTDSDLDKLQAFQRYAGRRIQRFPQRSPSCSSYYGLGWLRLETYVYVKKLLFLLTIIRMDDTHRIKMIFRERVMKFLKDKEAGEHNIYGSPTFDLLNMCTKFDVLDEVISMLVGNTAIISKTAWSKKIWEKAWVLDDVFWQTTYILNRDNDLLFGTVGKSQYMTWWAMSDKWPHLIRMCEVLSKIVCRTSMLKSDDYRLNDSTHCMKVCEGCDMFTTENMVHLLMQCPNTETKRLRMFERINEVYPHFDDKCREEPGEIAFWLLGKPINDVDIDTMFEIWKVAGYGILNIYWSAINQRAGIG